jgi:hypothetical protein
MFPQAEKIVLVQDNLNTHQASSFYENLPPKEAFALAQQFEMHYTPRHGSWLNMAELELGTGAHLSVTAHRVNGRARPRDTSACQRA